MLKGMVRHAFTIVEILITITIMGILLTLVVVNVNSTQVNARDTERKADIESITAVFETFRNTNNQTGGSDFAMSGLSYPDLAYIANDTTIKQVSPDIDLKAVRAPGVDLTQPMSLVGASNTVQTTAGILPQPTISTYVYQPLTSSNGVCEDIYISGECRKFNLYYMLEADNTVYMVTSKGQ